MHAHLAAVMSALLGWSICCQTPPEGPPRTTDVAVVVHPQCEIEGLSLEQLRGIATLEQQFWSSNRRIVLLLRPTDSAEMRVLLPKLYRMSGAALRRLWVEKLYAGRIPAIPTSVSSDDAVLANVARADNGFSFVCSGAVGAGVRVLPIEGKLPGEPGYPLTLRVE